VVVATPDVRLLTIDSRRVLPRTIPLQDVVFNLQRLAGLLHAVERRDASQMAEAFEDRCHQPYREPLVPLLRRALALRHPDILGVCLSGGGSSVVAFVRGNPASVERAFEDLYRRERVACTVCTRKIHQQPFDLKAGAARNG